MRSDLASVEGVREIKTDIKTKICTFQLANKELDLKAKLTELAKSNDHLQDFEIVKAMN